MRSVSNLKDNSFSLLQHCGLKVKDKYIFFLLMVAISFSPFYLMTKYTIFRGTPFWSFSGCLIIAIFLLVCVNGLMKGNLQAISQIDLLMKILFSCYILLCLWALFLGSDLFGVTRRFWQYCIGVMVYFIMVKTLNYKRIQIVETILCILSVVVAMLFLCEWVNVNVLGKRSMPWSLALNEAGVTKDYFISHGGASLTIGQVKRISGPLGTYAHTSLFVALGTIFLFFRMLIMGRSKKVFIAFIICLSAFVLCFYRTSLIALILSLVVAYLLLDVKNKKKLFRLSLRYFILLGIVICIVGGDMRGILYKFYYEKIIIDSFASSGGAFKHIASEYGGYIESFFNNPAITFVGTGLGYPQFESYGSGDTGWVSVATTVGIPVVALQVLIMACLIKKTRFLLRDRHVDPYLHHIALSSLVFILVSIFSLSHSGAMNVSANYFCFYAMIGMIVSVDLLYRNKQLEKLL
jgi:hypothetical protein